MRRPRLVVVGCGFAGYSLLRSLPRGRFETALVSPRNYFLFTPLLPSAATGTVEFRSIVEPARRRLRDVAVVEGRAEAVDWERRVLVGRAAVGGARFELPFDHLAVAAGAEVATYGVPGVAEHAVPFASVEDAREVRRRILEQFARASVPGAAAFADSPSASTPAGPASCRATSSHGVSLPVFGSHAFPTNTATCAFGTLEMCALASSDRTPGRSAASGPSFDR